MSLPMAIVNDAILFAEADFWTTLFANLPATILAVATLLTVILSHGKLSAKQEVQKRVLQDQAYNLESVATDVKTIEKATNSMKDALVLATRNAAFLEGKADERKNPETPVPSAAPKDSPAMLQDVPQPGQRSPYRRVDP